MSNLTVAIDQHVLHRARVRAVTEGTSVNAVVRDFLDAYADAAPVGQAIDSLLERSERLHAGGNARSRSWSRHELYDDRLGGRS